MTTATFLIKQAIPNAMKFVMDHPFDDRRPQVRDGYEQRQVAQSLYEKLPPLYKRTVDARQRGRQLVSSPGIN